MRSSYFHNGIPYTGKTLYLYIKQTPGHLTVNKGYTLVPKRYSRFCPLEHSQNASHTLQTPKTPTKAWRSIKWLEGHSCISLHPLMLPQPCDVIFFCNNWFQLVSISDLIWIGMNLWVSRDPSRHFILYLENSKLLVEETGAFSIQKYHIISTSIPIRS